MPSIIVKIEWDVPEDPQWLNPYNLELALGEYCPNTAFSVTDATDLLAACKFTVTMVGQCLGQTIEMDDYMEESVRLCMDAIAKTGA